MQVKTVVLLVLVALLIGSGATYCSTQEQESPLWLPARMMIGPDWLRMTPSERLFFVYGYHRGDSAGYYKACDVVAGILGEKNPDDPSSTYYKCLEPRRWRLLEHPATVAELITQFYEKYPQYRNEATDGLIEKFEHGASIEEVAASLAKYE